MGRYLLAVDGGNTKTDFALLEHTGALRAWVRTGTCSHEVLPGGYAAAGQALQTNITALCSRAGIAEGEIQAAVLGLAGMDTAAQRAGVRSAFTGLAGAKKLLVNDSFLAIKAACTGGVGICSINGTGTVAGGIDKTGRRLQVGGAGYALGDFGGGNVFATAALNAVYAACMRNGPATAMTAPTLALLECEEGPGLMDAIVEKFYGRVIPAVAFTRILFAAADEGDQVALGILHWLAKSLADSVLGCMARLQFDAPVSIVAAGSVWAKAETPLLFQAFAAHIHQNAPLACHLGVLRHPPVCGAASWAFELLHGSAPGEAQREQISAQFGSEGPAHV